MSFVSSYLDYTQIQEATERVHRWVGLSVLAAALERKIWVDRGSYTLYPNLYTFIVGPSGIVRKSTSTAMGVDLLRNIEGIRMMSEKVTSSALIQQLNRASKSFHHSGRDIKQSAVFAYASELHVLLDDVFGSIIELLTTFYDCIPHDSSQPWKYETISSGTTNIYGPCLNILGASTPTWLKKSIPPGEMEGGFASRVIFVVEDQAKRAIAFPDMETNVQDQAAQKRFLISELKRVYALTGAVKLTDAFRKEGQAWYCSHQNSLKTNTDTRFSGYYGRKLDTVLKVAMLFSVSEDSSLVVDVKHFEEALALLQDIESRMFNVFGSHGENPNGAIMEKVWRLVKPVKVISLSKVLRLMHRDASSERVIMVLSDLHAMHRVNRYKDDVQKDIFFSPIDPDEPL